jgi:hypothetical protein
VKATARKVVEIVDARSTTFGLVDARELAEELGVSIDCVYAHATELGAMRLGSGPKARIREGPVRPVPRGPRRSQQGLGGRAINGSNSTLNGTSGLNYASETLGPSPN